MSKAVKWYRKAADLQDTRAMRVLGTCYATGQGVAKDMPEAVKWYRKAADLQNADAMCALGRCYAFGEGIAKDVPEAVKWYRKAANLQDARAMGTLGSCYATGQGVAKDMSEAVKWFRKAADLQDVDAMGALGACYASGQGIAANMAEAAKWYRKAADLQNAGAMYGLGACYESGEGLAEDMSEAIKWYRKAADLQYGRAMCSLGKCYEFGRGVAEDKSEAVKWYRKAADLNDIRAMGALAACYESGRGVSKDGTEAIRWYRKGADLGDELCMGALGSIYGTGECVPQNDVYAYMWFSLAAARDNDYSKLRDVLRERMSASQIAEAQKLATAYFEQNKRASAPTTNVTDPVKLDPSASGTGFFVTTDGYLVTAYHVVAEAKEGTVKVNYKGTVLEARLIRMDAANDLALLKVDGSFTALAVIPSRTVKLGADVFSVGFPNIDLQGSAVKLTKGSVNSLAGIQDDPRAFQINVPIQPGNSGGPLLDASGNVIGVVVSQLDSIRTAMLTGSLPQGVNYAVKSSYLLPLLDTLPEASTLINGSKTRTFDEAVKSAGSAVCVVLTNE